MLALPEDVQPCAELGLQQPGSAVIGRCRIRHESGRDLVIVSRARVLHEGRSVFTIEDVTAANDAGEGEGALQQLNRALLDRVELFARPESAGRASRDH